MAEKMISSMFYLKKNAHKNNRQKYKLADYMVWNKKIFIVKVWEQYR